MYQGFGIIGVRTVIILSPKIFPCFCKKKKYTIWLNPKRNSIPYCTRFTFIRRILSIMLISLKNRISFNQNLLIIFLEDVYCSALKCTCISSHSKKETFFHLNHMVSFSTSSVKKTFKPAAQDHRHGPAV